MNLMQRIGYGFSSITRAMFLRSGGRYGGMVRFVGPASEGYAAAYGSSPRAMRENLMWSESGINVRWHARRAARANEFIIRFLARAEATAFDARRIERPAYPGLPAELAQQLGDAWVAWWRSRADSRGRRLCDAERQHFRDWLIDGEIFFDWPERRLRAIPADMITDYRLSEDDYAVSEWVTGHNAVDAGELMHVAIIRSNWQLRGRSYLAAALPELFPHMEYRDNSSTGIRDLSKIAAVDTNQEAGQAHGLPAVDAGYDAMAGPGDGDGNLDSSRERYRPTLPGFVADLKAGAKMETAKYGPPETAAHRAGESVSPIAIALGVSETELTGDHVKHNFASLQVAEARDVKTYTEIRQEWYRGFRLPVHDTWLEMAIANGEVPAEIVAWYPLISPQWEGPRLSSAQPLKDAQALEKMALLGQVSLKKMAGAQGENAERNAEENAAIMAGSGAANANEPPLDADAIGQLIDEKLLDMS